jgi:hypothetical protein
MSNGGPSLRTSGGGAAGSHPAPTGRAVRAAPTTADKVNTLRIAIFPIACWRVEDIRFDFDSSFVLPDIADELALLAKEIEEHKVGDKRPPLSIFGHADPIGSDDYNKKLSGRRAAAIYGLLTRRTDIWEDIFKHKGKFTAPLHSDNWGLKSIQRMLAHVGHDPGPIDGVMGSRTRAAVKSFQDSTRGELAVDGDPGPLTRAKLFKAYMDALCKDEAGGDFVLQATDFLGNGADETGKADYQGCSEFNPDLLFSQEEEDRFRRSIDKTERDAENAPNRRVVAFLYRPDLRVNPAKWPCPRAKEGFTKCKDRFWSDGEQRRSRRLPTERRRQEDTHDTFACRFYDRMASRSPCEGFFAGLTQEWVVKLLLPPRPREVPGPDATVVLEPAPPLDGEPLANASFVVTGAGGPDPQITGTTDGSGVLRIPVTTNPTDMVLTLTRIDPDTGQPRTDAVTNQPLPSIILTLKGGGLPVSGAGDDVKHRLFNLGYGKNRLREWDQQVLDGSVKRFKHEHALTPEDATIDDAVRAKLKEVHGS